MANKNQKYEAAYVKYGFTAIQPFFCIQIVMQLCSRFRNTGRNITMDNFFTSVPLAQHLLEKDLTIVGTLRQNKPDIPPLMKASKSREVQSTEFGFNGNFTMVNYVRKKGKAVVLLSMMHHDKVVEESSRKKKT